MGTTEIALLSSVCVNFVAIYRSFRKSRTEARQADATADTEIEAARAKAEAEIEATVISRWQAYAAEQEAARKREAEALRTEIRELRDELHATHSENVECRERAARQETEIAHLKAEQRGMRAALRRAGITVPGSGDHEPLKET